MALKRTPSALGLLDIIDNIDRPAEAFADGAYADTETYTNGFEDKPGKRIPKAGAVAEAGVGRAGASWSIFTVGAQGPHASLKAEAKGLEAGAMAHAELGSVSAVAGPAKLKLGLGIDTGFKISPTKVKGSLGKIQGHSGKPETARKSSGQLRKARDREAQGSLVQLG
ncbi:hypothetical protein HF521_020982 [Silurus meridionalis]|uniref:Uncharacterized protein n=1 Tax=Silurus meridionalis TaxID=175797 RepID=A0A8T0BJK8_SILME|nr:hypothetical protein HF521_020982 [Silurus meridionalis]